MTWIQVAVSVVCAVVGGFVGGWVVAFKLGRWRQSVEDRLDSVEKRLGAGDRLLDVVPVIRARLDVMLEEIRELKRSLHDERQRFVTHEECDRRHDAR